MIGLFLPPAALDVSKIKYSQKLISIFDKKEFKNKFLILTYEKDINLLIEYVNHLTIKPFNLKKIRKKFLKISGKINSQSFLEYQNAISIYGIKFGIFPVPPMGISNCTIPFAAAIQSMGHRLNPELRECAENNVWRIREDNISAVCKNAKMIFIDSEVGKEYLKFYYNSKSEIIVIPHNLPDVLEINVSKKEESEILKKFGISKQYLFLPGQFWPHKNHIRIFEALIYLKKQGLDLQIVFTGSSKAIRKEYNIEYMLKRIVRNSDMENNLIITGYLNDTEMKSLYANASAMIMPQLIPEPCIPYIEAMALKCPVIASDIPGIKDQVQNAAILVNPYSIKSIANGIESLFKENSSEELANNGFKVYNNTKKEISEAFLILEKKLLNIVSIN